MMEPTEGTYNTTYIDSVMQMVEHSRHPRHAPRLLESSLCQAHRIPADYSHGYTHDYTGSMKIIVLLSMERM